MEWACRGHGAARQENEEAAHGGRQAAHAHFPHAQSGEGLALSLSHLRLLSGRDSLSFGAQTAASNSIASGLLPVLPQDISVTICSASVSERMASLTEPLADCSCAGAHRDWRAWPAQDRALRDRPQGAWPGQCGTHDCELAGLQGTQLLGSFSAGLRASELELQ